MPVLTAEGDGRIDKQRDRVIIGRERHVVAQEDHLGGYPSRALRNDKFLYIRNYEPDRWPAGTPHHLKSEKPNAWLADCDNGPTKFYMFAHRKDDKVKKLYDLAFAKRPAEELYDLEKDPDQLNNVAGDPAYADVKKRLAGERDLHYAMTNITAALAADAVWFNSTYHRDVFTTAARDFLANMPDHQPVGSIDRILEKSSIQPPGITPAPPRGPRAPGPLRIVWAARWEHDKDPEEFFDAMRALKARGVDFRLSVLGQQFDQTPACFAAARRDLAGHLDHFGYIESPAAYRQILQTRDVFVSTARHAFFGIAPMEAAATGCIPALP